ncbi:hypothetical protein M426DRAFT_75075 [Hypoxylon sp. CI-4A]|nr:hypothetical protein M426DRAFT_75075 [Hypoxylon sp. CI-4A]
MKYSELLLAAASFTASVLEVTLAPNPESNGAAELIATIRNAGSEDLNLLNAGTLLDDFLPVQKVAVVNEAGVEAPFIGIHPSFHADSFTTKHFRLLKAGESLTTGIKAAAVHEFTESRTYTFTAAGHFPVAPAGTTKLSGPALEFQSNGVEMEVDVGTVQAVPNALSRNPLEGRTTIADGCNATQLEASTAAIKNCVTLAQAAAVDAADISSSRFVEYFKTNSSTTRKTVVDRLTAVAQECSTTDSGISRYFCYDYYNLCETDGPLNAYTKFDFDFVVMCPLFYNTLPPLPQSCHHQDQATTTIHEMTHCEDVFSPHTNDFVYGYNESVALTAEKALLNADTYSLYANAVYMKC